jgi:hypothetical protein
VGRAAAQADFVPRNARSADGLTIPAKSTMAVVLVPQA